jgi:rare lipoprotein A
MRHPILLSLIVLCALLSLGCAAMRHDLNPGVTRSLAMPLPQLGSASLIHQAQAGPPAPPRARGQVGAASYYDSFFDGRKTANGETFSSQMLTAASLTLDFGTRVRVTNLVNLKTVIVTINDRGPYVSGRIIDLTRRAASTLGFVRDGVARVRVEPIVVASAF